jgi:hypothetical protein
MMVVMLSSRLLESSSHLVESISILIDSVISSGSLVESSSHLLEFHSHLTESSCHLKSLREIKKTPGNHKTPQKITNLLKIFLQQLTNPLREINSHFLPLRLNALTLP